MSIKINTALSWGSQPVNVTRSWVEAVCRQASSINTTCKPFLRTSCVDASRRCFPNRLFMDARENCEKDAPDSGPKNWNTVGTPEGEAAAAAAGWIAWGMVMMTILLLLPAPAMSYLSAYFSMAAMTAIRFKPTFSTFEPKRLATLRCGHRVCCVMIGTSNRAVIQAKPYPLRGMRGGPVARASLTPTRSSLRSSELAALARRKIETARPRGRAREPRGVERGTNAEQQQ